ncbi:MAG: hypothetical protein ACK5KT_03515 [Dysgonomonas sp.]
MGKFRLSKNARNAIFVFIIAFSAFLAFEPLFEHLGQKAAQEFTAAIFGTIFAAVITMVLLSKQTETEEEKSRSEKVFEEKLELYHQAIDTLQRIFEKADSNNQVRLERSAIVELEFLLAKLIMVADEKTIHQYRLICQSISRNYVPETGILSITSADKHMIFRFSDFCRQELGLSSRAIEKQILEDIVLDGELFLYLKQSNVYSNDLIENLKDIYGCLVFDLSIPLQQMTFESDGFIAFLDETKQDILIKCNITENKLSLYMPRAKTGFKTKHYKFNEQRSLDVMAGERNKFLDDLDILRHEIQYIKSKTS